MVTRGLLVTAIALVIVACASSAPERSTVEVAPDAAEPDGSSPSDARSEAGDADAAPSCVLPGVYGSNECMACIGDRCCAEVTSCEAQPECKELQRCALECSPKPDAGGCLAGCFETYPSGKARWDAVYACWFGTPPGGCLVACTND